MHDFVLGKRVAPLIEGNCVELLDSPESKKPAAKSGIQADRIININDALNASKENRHNHRAPLPLPKPASTLIKKSQNPYFKPNGDIRISNNSNNNHNAVRNPYSVARSQQQQKQDSTVLYHRQQQQQQQQDIPKKGASTTHTNHENVDPSANSKPPQHSFFEKNTNKRKKCQQQQTVHRYGFSPGPVPHNPETASTYIYPKHPDYPTRQYQQEITETALNYNTLVSLPTGLGKTHIAAVVMYNYYRWFTLSNGNSSCSGKIIFLAPTLPLVNQQIEACYKIAPIPGHETAVLTGRLKASERKELWKTKRVFYCTPQTVQKDLLGACGHPIPDATSRNGKDNSTSIDDVEDLEVDPETALAFSRVVCLVLDEAHKASGDYAYTRVVDLLEKAAGAKFRIVGLSATPGTTIRAIQGVIEALRSCKIEARTDSDKSVVPYLHQKQTEIVICPRNTYQREVSRKMSGILHPLLERLREEGGLTNFGNETLTAYSVLKAKQLYAKRSGRPNGGLISCFHAAYTLVQIRNDCHQGLGVVKTKLLRLKNTPQRGILSTISKSEEFSELIQTVLDVTNGNVCENVTDPKLTKLCELLKHHFERSNACNNSSRAIVFAQFRDSVKEIVNCLESTLRPLVRSRYFVGQNKGSTGGTSSTSGNKKMNPNENVQGMKQAEQQRAIKDFRNNVFNVLVCTSIGEEGLDIGDVDLIINYDVISSPIRTIQRAGRTGRKRDGRVVSLISEGSEEKTYKKRLAGEKTLNNALKNPKKFVMASHHPMLPNSPVMEYKVFAEQKLSLSEVAGAQHTPAASKRSESEWRLDASEEYERQNLCGDIIVHLDNDVTWKRLRGFFCKNRVDPTKLQGKFKANRRHKSFKIDDQIILLKERNKIRERRQGNRGKGRIEGILDSMKEFGPIHSEGTTRSGYKNILSIFPVDPDLTNDKSAVSATNSTRVSKKLWEDVSSNGKSHLASATSSVPKSQLGTDSSKSATTAVLPELFPERDKVANKSGLNNSSDDRSSGDMSIGKKTLPNQNSCLHLGPSIDAGATENCIVEKTGIMVSNSEGRIPPRDLPHSNDPSSSMPQEQVAETAIFRLPTPPPSSDDDSSVASNMEKENHFKLPTPSPSSDDDSSAASKTAKESNFKLPSNLTIQDARVSPKKEEGSGFRLPTQHSSSDSSSDEREEIVVYDSNREEEPAQQKHVQPDISNDKAVFRLPTPSSSSDSDEDCNDDSDTITVPEPSIIGGIPPEKCDSDLGPRPKLDESKSSPITNQFPSSDVRHDSPAINLENEKFKPMETKPELFMPVAGTPDRKQSLGFDGENDIALHSLKKSRPSANVMRPNSGDIESGSDSEEDVPLISFCKEKTGLTKNEHGGTSLANKSEGKNKKHKLHAASGGAESEEDFPLISLSNKKKKKSKSSQLMTKDVPLIDLKDIKNIEQGNNPIKKHVPSRVSLGNSLPLQGKNSKIHSNGRKQKGSEEPEREESDQLLASFKKEKKRNQSSNALPKNKRLASSESIADYETSKALATSRDQSSEEPQTKKSKSPTDEVIGMNKQKCIEGTESSGGILLIRDSISGSSKDASQNHTNKQSKVDLQILETSESIKALHPCTEAPVKQNQNQNELIDNSKYGKQRSKRPRILETPESTCSHLHVDLTSTSTQEPSQNEVIDHSTCKANKCLKIGSESDDCEENEQAKNVEMEQSLPESTPRVSVHHLASTVLEDTPQADGGAMSNRSKKRSPSDMLTDTPITNTVDNISEDIVCEVCASGDSADSDPLVLCDGCNKGFHKNCYSINVDVDSPMPWYCDSCIYRSEGGKQAACPNTAMVCTYCCQREGALRNDGRTWYHPLCAAFACKITADSCEVCSLVGAVKCQHNACSRTIHPHCALGAGWVITRSKSSEYSIFCPNHKGKVHVSPPAGGRIMLKEFSAYKKNRSIKALSRPKKILKKSSKLIDNDGKSTNKNTCLKVIRENTTLLNSDHDESPNARRNRLRERRRQGLAKFVLEEAEIGSDQERDDFDEEAELRRIEEEEEGYSQDSFINDNVVLTQHFSQDLLGEVDPDAATITDGARANSSNNSMDHNSHRALDALRERENQFKTPIFNRRMMRSTQDSSSTPSSAQGLGNMHFIRGVLEHHRRGGNCDQIEAEYQRLETSSNTADANGPIEPANLSEANPTNSNRSDAWVDLTTPQEDNGSNRHASYNPSNTNQLGSQSNIASGNSHARQPRSTSTMAQGLPEQAQQQGGGLTVEQLARIEANRQAALRRRAELLAKKQQDH